MVKILNSLRASRYLQIVAAMAFLSIFAYQQADAQYCQPYGYYSYYGHITNFTFEGINCNSTYYGYPNTNYPDYMMGYENHTDYKTKPLSPGNEYKFSLTGHSLWGENYSAYEIWVDWNQNGSFYDAGESVSSVAQGGQTFYGSIKVPSNAKNGKTRLRIAFWGYYYYWDYYGRNQPCLSYYQIYDPAYYMEYEDYTVDIGGGNDAGITTISSPNDFFDSFENQEVKCVIRNFATPVLQSAVIRWAVNGVQQTPINWKGSLKKDDTETIILGKYKFTPKAPWDPFVVEAWTENPFGSDDASNKMPDSNPSNDRAARKIKCLLNDAGFVTAEAMIPIAPGVNNVILTIKNYGPRPLTSCQIKCTIRGYEFPPFQWKGNLAMDQQEDVVIGTYNFGSGSAEYEVYGETAYPNGEDDERKSNDKGMTVVYRALEGGTYIIGSSAGADFPTLVQAMSFINFWGLTGPATFKFQAGTYNGNVQIKPRGARQQPLTFESMSGSRNDVVIQHNPVDAGNNYLLMLSSYNNVLFRNLTLRSQSANYSRLMYLQGDCGGITIDNCVLTGSTTAPNTADNALIYSSGKSDGIKVLNSSLTGGSYGIYLNSPGGMTSGAELLGNSIRNMTSMGIFTQNIGNAKINENRITGTSFNYGIYAGNGGEIMNNIITGITGIDRGGITAMEAGIMVRYNGASALVTGNTVRGNNAHGIYLADLGSVEASQNIINMTTNNGVLRGGITLLNSNGKMNENSITNNNVDGIHLENSTAEILKNKVNISGGYTGINLVESNAAVGNNMVGGTDCYAFGISNSGGGGGYGIKETKRHGDGTLDLSINGMNIYYNSFVANSNTPAVLMNNNGKLTLMRNMFYNSGTGLAMQLNSNNLSVITSDENNIFTMGGTLANLNGKAIANLVAWQQNTGFDNGSVNQRAYFMSPTDFRLTRYNPEFENGYALGIGEVEDHDKKGQARVLNFYPGADEIVTAITISENPEGFVECEKAEGMSMTVKASVDFGANILFQWRKNGVDISGEIEPIMFFDPLEYDMSARYSCLIRATGGAESQITEEAVVYVLRETKILKQPKNAYADLGGVARFEAEAIDVHGQGDLDPLNTLEYQWYAVTTKGDTIKLVNSEAIAGAKSNHLTINYIVQADMDKAYFVKVTGRCGVDNSNLVYIKEMPKIVINNQPADIEECANKDANFHVAASISEQGVKLSYQWYKDGAELLDGGNISGAMTENLNITGVTVMDAGNYVCEVTAGIDGLKVTSDAAALIVHSGPELTLQPIGGDVEEDETITLTVAADGFGNVSYQWYKDGVELDGETNATYSKENALVDDAGEYSCLVKDDCGELMSDVAVIVITNGGISEVSDNVLNGYELQSNTPNPFSVMTSINFVAPLSGKVQIQVSDVYGREIAAINADAKAGLNRIEFNAGNLSSGVYFYTLISGGTRLTRQMVIVK